MSEPHKPHVLVVIDPNKDVDWSRHPVAHPTSRTVSFGVCKEICALDNTRGGGGFFRMAHQGNSRVEIGVFQKFTDAHTAILRRWGINNWRIESPKQEQPAGLRDRARRILQQAAQTAFPLAR